MGDTGRDKERHGVGERSAEREVEAGGPADSGEEVREGEGDGGEGGKEAGGGGGQGRREAEGAGPEAAAGQRQRSSRSVPLADQLPAPSLVALPGPVVAPGTNVSLRCAGRLRGMSFALYRVGVAAPLQYRDSAEPWADFPLPGASAPGTYSCYYHTPSSPYVLSLRSEPLVISADGEGSAPRPSPCSPAPGVRAPSSTLLPSSRHLDPQPLPVPQPQGSGSPASPCSPAPGVRAPGSSLLPSPRDLDPQPLPAPQPRGPGPQPLPAL